MEYYMVITTVAGNSVVATNISLIPHCNFKTDISLLHNQTFSFYLLKPKF